MSTDTAVADALPRPNYLNVRRSIQSWLLTTDHKRIGILYLISITVFFLVGGLFAALIRIELENPVTGRT